MREINDQDLAQRIEQRVQARKTRLRWVFFVLNIVLFIIAVSVGVGVAIEEIPAAFEEEALGLVITMAMMWLTTIGFNLITALSDSGVLDRSHRRRALRHALDDRMMDQMLDQHTSKRKRDRLEDEAMTVDDEGELIPLDDQHRSRNR